ncbi:geranylgeranylglycerol-phosphate geranylgeranyltransferase [Flavobacterium sp.]|uniref:geranylgeranylglycerol-phosphate geranylgeranyltransferase n=1 Tax=Flavobacterium sp. TaxID=239 RepID=UPI00352931F8
MLTRKSKLLVLKIFSFFSVIRGYNIWVVALAQYLSAIFILAPNEPALTIISDWRLFIIVLCSSLSIASGYIINNFYDAKKDLINRPKKVMIDRLVRQSTKLKVYFTINFVVVALALLISWRAAFFFSSYIFLLWFYSHKLKKFPIIGNLTAALLVVIPFFGVLMYFKNFYHVIFAHATFLFLLLLIREFVKDLENIEGDLVTNYQTIPVRFGEKIAKISITFLICLTIFPVYFLTDVYNVGYMEIYFYVSLIMLVFFLIKLWKSEQKSDYIKLHFLLKFVIVSGVFSIMLIDLNVLQHGRALLSQV